jgi:co-chaperonin GroES (HSP10)
MKLDGVTIKPAEGKLAVRFVDDPDADDQSEAMKAGYMATQSSPSPISNDGCLAEVIAVGPKVKNAKKGDVVVTNEWARDGVKLDDGVTIVDDYCVLAIVA